MKNDDDEIMTLDDDTEVFSLDDDSSQNIEENIEKENVFSGQSYDMNEESHNIDEPVANSNLYQNNYNQYNTNVVSNDYNTVVNPVPVEPDYNETDMVGEQNYNQDSTITNNYYENSNNNDYYDNSSNNDYYSSTGTLVYIAAGNRYYHKTANCKFISGSVVQQVYLEDHQDKFECNCWKY